MTPAIESFKPFYEIYEIKLALPKIMLISVFRSKKKREKGVDANKDFADVTWQKSILRQHFFADVKKSEFQRLLAELHSGILCL